MSTFENISVDLSIVLGTSLMPVHQLLRMGRGAVIELATYENEDVEILANDVPVARGQVMLNGDRIGVSITEVLLRRPDFRPKHSVISMKNGPPPIHPEPEVHNETDAENETDTEVQASPDDQSSPDDQFPRDNQPGPDAGDETLID